VNAVAQPAGSMGPAVAAGALAFSLLAATAAGWFVIPHSGAARSGIMIAIWVNIAIMLGALAIEARRRPYSLHLMHLLSLFLFLGSSSLFQYSKGTFGVAGPIQGVRGQVALAVLAVALWLVGYLGGYEGTRLAGRSTGPMVRFLARPVGVHRTALVLLLAAASLGYLGVAGLAGVVTRGAALVTMEEFAMQAGVGGYTSVFYLIHHMLLRAFSPVALLPALMLFARDRRSRNAVFVLLIATVALGTLVINNPFASSRMWLALTGIAFLSPFVLRRLRTGWALVMIALGGIAFLPALHEARYLATFDEWLDYFVLVSPLDYLSTNSDVDSLGMLTLCQRWTESHGHRWGMQMLGGALFWFPRTLWRSKPVETGAMVTEDLGFEFTNLAPPIMSDPLVDFGLLGVPVCGALFGTLLARLDRFYWKARDAGDTSLRVIDFIYPFWLGCVIFLTRGGLFASLTYTASFTVWIVLFAVGQRRRVGAREPRG
jgi:hypothetical protein